MLICHVLNRYIYIFGNSEFAWYKMEISNIYLYPVFCMLRCHFITLGFGSVFRLRIACLYSLLSMPMQRCITYEMADCTVCTPSTVHTLNRTGLLFLSTSYLYTTQDFSVELRSELRSELSGWVGYIDPVCTVTILSTPPLFSLPERL